MGQASNPSGEGARGEGGRPRRLIWLGVLGFSGVLVLVGSAVLLACSIGGCGTGGGEALVLVLAYGPAAGLIALAHVALRGTRWALRLLEVIGAALAVLGLGVVVLLGFGAAIGHPDSLTLTVGLLTVAAGLSIWTGAHGVASRP